MSRITIVNLAPTLLKKRWILFVFLLFSIAPQYTSAQAIPQSLNYRNFTIKDGLPSLETYDIFHDSQGYTWIATDNGVVKYDGKTFTTLTTQNGLTDNTVFRIQEDQFGRVWFLTYNRKLCYLNKHNQFIPFEFNDQLAAACEGLFVGHHFTDLVIDDKGTFSLTTSNFMYFEIDSTGNTTSAYEINSRPQFEHLLNLKSYTDFYNYIKTNIPLTSYPRKFIFNNRYIKKATHLILTDRLNYIGTSEGVIITNNTFTKFKQVLKSFYITGVSTDFEGGFWCSTLFNGVIYISNNNIQTFKVSTKLSSHIHSIIPLKEDLIFCYGGQKNYFRYNDSNLFPFNRPIDSDQIVDSLFRKGIKIENSLFFKNVMGSATGGLRFGNSKTIFSIDKRSIIFLEQTKSKDFINYNKALTPHNTIKLIDVNGQSWYTDTDLKYSMKLSDSTIINRNTYFTKKTFKIAGLRNEMILLGTNSGIYNLNTETGEAFPSLDFEELSEFRIQDIIELPDSSIAIATKSNGLFLYKDSDIHKISGPTKKHFTYYQLIYDYNQKGLIAATNRGIQFFHFQNNSWKSEILIDEMDGLSTSDVRQIFLSDKILFFANADGVSTINRTELYAKISPPIIANVQMSPNKNASTQETFPYDSNTIEFQVTSISYKSEQKLSYLYRLLPIQTIWKSSENPQISFNSLPPNQYVFEVKSINLEGTESEVYKIEFEILPAFWMTTWFRLLVLLGVIFIIFLVTQQTINYYKKQSQIQKNLKELQIMSMQSKMNPHFIFNSLNSIQNYILKNDKEKANEYLLEFSKLIRIILKNSNSSSITLQNELDTLKLYVDLEEKRLRKQFKYIVKVDSSIDVRNCLIPSLLIQPYVENSIWHGQVYNNPHGQVSITILKVGQKLHIEITDNGIGVKNAQNSKVRQLEHESFGSEITKNRIQLLGELNAELSEIQIGELDPEETLFVGTKICFTIPYKLNE